MPWPPYIYLDFYTSLVPTFICFKVQLLLLIQDYINLLSEHHSIGLTASFPYPACKGVLLFQPSAIQLVLRGQFNQQYKQYEGNRGQFNRTRDLALATTDALGHQFWWLYTTGGQNWLQPPILATSSELVLATS